MISRWPALLLLLTAHSRESLLPTCSYYGYYCILLTAFSLATTVYCFLLLPPLPQADPTAPESAQEQQEDMEALFNDDDEEENSFSIGKVSILLLSSCYFSSGYFSSS